MKTTYSILKKIIIVVGFVKNIFIVVTIKFKTFRIFLSMQFVMSCT